MSTGSSESSEMAKSTILAMWGAAAVIDFAVALSTTDNGNALGWAFVIPMVVALIGTLFVLGMQMERDKHRINAETLQKTEQEKPKRNADDNLALLLDLMDEDERQAFKAKLEQRILDNISNSADGELPAGAGSLEMLMQEDQDEYRHR